MSTEQEFRQAVELINSCIATLQCGCEMTEESNFYSDSLYYRCKKYMAAYRERALTR